MPKAPCRTTWPNADYNIGKASDPNINPAARIKYNHRLHICLKDAPHLGEECQCHKCMVERQ